MITAYLPPVTEVCEWIIEDHLLEDSNTETFIDDNNPDINW